MSLNAPATVDYTIAIPAAVWASINERSQTLVSLVELSTAASPGNELDNLGSCTPPNLVTGRSAWDDISYGWCDARSLVETGAY